MRNKAPLATEQAPFTGGPVLPQAVISVPNSTFGAVGVVVIADVSKNAFRAARRTPDADTLAMAQGVDVEIVQNLWIGGEEREQ